ncbi:uncharacterized protein LOC141600513 [Silene latifolia]|uniref:uncharacterized protein LOC141600513 n=1 Tax=Silene latifolia TaxID=37657 RepID=UPI003D77FEF8
MAQKHLKELLQEDQEPFYLKDYIADKKCMLKKQAPKIKTQQIQVKKPKNTTIFSKNACFFSIQDSPDLRKSPLFDFTSSPMSKKSPNRVLLHVPAKTASLLLEAAMRIQQKSSKPKTNVKQSSFGLFGSMLKRLTLRNRTHKLKNSDIDDNVVFATNILVANNNSNSNSNNIASVSCSSSSCCNGTSSSLDLESSCSSGRSFSDNDDYNDDEFEFVNVLKENNNNNINNNINENNEDFGALCLSPFRFANSPARHIIEDKKSYEKESSSVKCQLEEDEDEEDKEQNSPVSVLDPPFEDDYDGHDEDYYDQQCSYALVQRAKQRLLHKLNRFEQLAELDPIELEKRMSEDEKYGHEQLESEQAPEIDEYDFESFTFTKIENSPDFYEDIVKKPGIKRLISDLIIEEENVENVMDNDQMLIKRVCNRLESWKQVECNTIDMMVEMDLKADIGDWKKHQTEISETSIDIEGAIFAVLVKELVSDLAYSADC